MPQMSSGKPDTINQALDAPQQSDHELLEQILQEQKKTAASQKAAAAAGWCIAVILLFSAERYRYACRGQFRQFNECGYENQRDRF